MISGIPTISDGIESAKIRFRDVRIDYSNYGLEIDDAIDQLIAQDISSQATASFKTILSAIKAREQGSKQSIHVVSAKFGGGKTFLLANLHAKLKHLSQFKILVINGHSVSDRTIWGECLLKINPEDKTIASRFTKLDEERIVPSLEEITSLLGSAGKSLVILLDELVVYLKKSRGITVGDTNLADLSLAFLHTLSVAISKSKKHSLIVTTAAGEDAYKKESQEVNVTISGFHSLFARLAPVFSPIEQAEVGPILRSHFIEFLDPEFAHQVADRISHSTGILSSEIEHSYPFHPDLIRILWIDFGEISGFHKMRGILRLISLSLKESLEDQLITTLPLYRPEVLDEITTKIGRGELREIILAELKRASKISRLATNICSVIILYTILGQGTTRKTLHSFFKSEKTPVGMINDTLTTLMQHQWYLHQESDGYNFSNQANIVKIIEDEASLVSTSEVENEVRKRIEEKLKI
ncbi:MAG: DUF499 domain-containing protein, partial [Candidatus Kariarchaeaceae archaeon]